MLKGPWNIKEASVVGVEKAMNKVSGNGVRKVTVSQIIQTAMATVVISACV